MAAVRTFNTTGPVVAADHYCIPPLERIDLGTVLGLIRDKKYFVRAGTSMRTAGWTWRG